VPLREFFFKTTSASNLLCQFTRREQGSWILIHLLRGSSTQKAERALFMIHARRDVVDRFLVEDFGRRYGTYEVLAREDDVTSVEVSNYLLPAYRGMDAAELATSLLGRDAFFAPILVEGGYIHIKVVASSRAASVQFSEVLARVSKATNPEDFKLLQVADYDPTRRLKPRADQLSPRQAEMLKMAIEMGYYDDPRRCTLQTLAQQFGVSKAAVHKRLVSAESKILKAYFP
jgi:predicted DNA binding protein